MSHLFSRLRSLESPCNETVHGVEGFLVLGRVQLEFFASQISPCAQPPFGGFRGIQALGHSFLTRQS